MARNRKDEIRNSNPFGSRAPSLDSLMDMMSGAAPDEAKELSALPFADGRVTFSKYTITPTGLVITSDLSLEEWENIGQTIRGVNQALPWIVGDLMVYGARVWGKTYEDVAHLVGRSVGTVYNWASVAGSVEFSRRREKLHFSHHVLVAPFDPESQSQWLEHAEENHLSTRKLDAEIKLASGEVTPPEVKSTLGDKSHRRLFNRLWSDVAKGKPINRDQIQHLRHWLDELEKQLGGEGHA